MGVFGTQRIFQVDRIVVYFVILLGFVYMAVRKYDLSREKELEQNWIILILTGSILGILDIFLFQNTGKFALIKVVAFAMALEGYAFLTFRYRNQGKRRETSYFSWQEFPVWQVVLQVLTFSHCCICLAIPGF